MSRYLTARELKENKSYLSTSYHSKSNYFIRNLIVQNLVKKYLNKDAKIVEVGSGGGRLAKDLLAMGYSSIDLIDIDNYLEGIDQNLVRLHMLDLSFDTLPIETGSADLLLAIAIIEHLENPVLIVREAARILKTGGKFFVAIPWIFSWRSRVQFLFNGELKGYNTHNNHISLFTRAIFEKVFLKDFNVVDVIYGESYIKFFNRKLRFKRCYSLWSDKVLFVLEKKS